MLCRYTLSGGHFFTSVFKEEYIIMDIQTAFEILGLDSNATIDEVKKVHRKFIAKWHPDKHTNNKIKLAVAVGVTKDLNSARDCLLEYLSQSIHKTHASPVMGQDAYDTAHISEFINDVCSFDPFVGAVFEELYFVYDIWCLENNLKPLSGLQLVDSLEGLGFFPIRKQAKSYFQSIFWNGFKLNNDWEEKIIQIREDMEFAFESEDPDRNHSEFTDMEDDDDLSEVAF